MVHHSPASQKSVFGSTVSREESMPGTRKKSTTNISSFLLVEYPPPHPHRVCFFIPDRQAEEGSRCISSSIEGFRSLSRREVVC